MGADLSNIKGVLRFELGIFVADILKGIKRSRRQSRHQKNTRNERSGSSVCSLICHFRIQRISLVKTVVTTDN